MTPEQRKRFKLKVIQEMNSRIAASHNNLFKPNATEVTMPAKEYDVLIKAQDALKDMVRGIADGKAAKESERLRLFQVFITFPSDMVTNAATALEIKMTILAMNESDADDTTRQILKNDGYSNLSTSLVHISEIKGPFKSGFVISRYGG